jgi:hypothetical protein
MRRALVALVASIGAAVGCEVPIEFRSRADSSMSSDISADTIGDRPDPEDTIDRDSVGDLAIDRSNRDRRPRRHTRARRRARSREPVLGRLGLRRGAALHRRNEHHQRRMPRWNDRLRRRVREPRERRAQLRSVRLVVRRGTSVHHGRVPLSIPHTELRTAEREDYGASRGMGLGSIDS